MLGGLGRVVLGRGEAVRRVVEVARRMVKGVVGCMIVSEFVSFGAEGGSAVCSSRLA